MIVFIPAWDSISNDGLSSDDLMGQIKSYVSGKDSYSVLIPHYIPYLRYFLHKYDLLESQYTNVFDIIQGTVGMEQKKIQLQDLSFPEKCELYYTPFHILVYLENQEIGRVCFGEEGYISEVQYIENGETTSVEVYDDRGFLSSVKYYKSCKIFYTEFLDINGVCVIKYYADGQCEVNRNKVPVKYGKYQSMGALIYEIIEKTLEEFYNLRAIVISLTNDNISYLSKSSYQNKMILSVFQNRIRNYSHIQEEIKNLLIQVPSVITENTEQKKYLSALSSLEEKIQTITPYDTRFELSISQELEQEILYVDLRNNTRVQSALVIDILLKYVLDKRNQEEKSRKFKVIFRTNTQNDATMYRMLYMSKLRDLLPVSFDKIEIFREVQDESLFELTDDESLFQRLQEVFEFLVVRNDEELFKIIHRTRLIIDLSSPPDLFTQISGISAGLPQINLSKTVYVHHLRNGLIIKSLDDLYGAVEYYLENLSNWQQARMWAANAIKKYSGYALYKRLQNMVGEIDGHE